MSEVRDQWAAASMYEGFMGRWSRQLAPRFLSWLRIPPGVHWLDVGCGTGALTNAICAHAEPASVLGCDPAPPFIEYARAHATDARASFAVAGAGSLPGRADGYGSVTSLLALNFLPDHDAATHGAVSACIWDYGDGMEFLRYFWDAAAAGDAAARELHEGARFPICRSGALLELFRRGGLRDVRCEPIEIPTKFSNFGDYWQPFLGGTGPAASYVASLDADRRATLAREVEEALPQTRTGAIVLTARAWAARGTAG